MSDPVIPWTPSTPNGWHPRVWAQGSDLFVSYGFGECWLAHLHWQGGAFALVREAQIIGAGGFAGHWLAPFILTCWQERPDAGKDYWQRSEVDVRGDWTPRVVEGPSALVGGNLMAASGGHVMEKAGPRLRYDTAILSETVGASAAQRGAWVSAAADPEHTAILQWHAGAPTGERRPVGTPLHEMGAADDGSVAYGGYGAIHGFRPGGPDEDLTAAPWRWEGAPFLWPRPDGALWLATITYVAADPSLGTLLRPWAAQDVILVSGPAVFVTVAEDSGHFFVATCDDKGRLALHAVPVDTPRVILTTPAPPMPVIGRPAFWTPFEFARPSRA